MSERTQRDGGVTLVELLLAVSIIGLLMASITAAFTVVLRSQKPTLDRLSESKDVLFVETWVPIDLASAKSIDVSPTLQPAAESLPGSNALTITRYDLGVDPPVEFQVSYRYEEENGEWRLVRYEIRNGVKRDVVAHALPAPPALWVPGDLVPTNVLRAVSRQPTDLRASGVSFTVTFNSGNSFTSGGAGLGPGTELGPVDLASSGSMSNPANTAPPTSCGSSIAVAINSSAANLAAVKVAAKSFIDGVAGTGTRLRIVSFGKNATSRLPTSWAAGGVSLTDPANVTAAKSAVDLTVASNDANWEEAVRLAATDFNNTIGIGKRPTDQPQLVVLITDKSPNYMDKNSNPGNDLTATAAVGTAEAVTVAEAVRAYDTRVVAVVVDPTPAPSTSITSNMEKVVGPSRWTTTGPDLIGNAASADLFTVLTVTGTPSAKLALEAIAASECGGTITVRKVFTTSTPSPTNGSWLMTTSVGTREIKLNGDPSRRDWFTFDYTLPPSEPSRSEYVIETTPANYRIDTVKCSTAGGPMTTVTPTPDGIQYFVDVQRMKPVRCDFTSKPA